MALLDLRQRTGWLFMAVAVGHILIITAQVNTRRGVPILSEITFGTFAEVQRAASSAIGSVRDVWSNYVSLQQIRHENEQLRDEVSKLRVGLQQERAVAEQTRTLQQLLDLRTATPLTTQAASVIAGGASPEFRTITIDKGTTDGLASDMAVISPSGVVGRVVLPTLRASKVQLLIDRDAAAGAIVERSRAQGVLVGTGTDRLRLDHVPGTVELKVGDRVVTSGIEGIYPKGFAIGQIESFERRAGEFTAVMVRPAVEFANLEAVLVVTSPPQVDVSGRGKKGEAAAKAHETSPPKANESAVPGAAARKPDATRKPAATPAARSAGGNGAQSTNPAAESTTASRPETAAPPAAPEAR